LALTPDRCSPIVTVARGTERQGQLDESWEEAAAATARWDEAVRGAVARVAATIRPVSGELEIGEQRNLVPALAAEFGSHFGADKVATGKKLLAGRPLPDWDPLPGAVDLLIGESPAPQASPWLGIEAKSRTHRNKLAETPYDIFKMAALRRLDGVEATYLVVAATLSAFSSDEPGAALFNTPLNAGEEWYSAYFVTEWLGAWAQLLAESSGKPLRVPRTLRLELVSLEEVSAFPGWEIRALRVENPIYESWLVFGAAGWPTHLDPDPWASGPRQIRDDCLRLGDVPSLDCDESELHLFALSCDGYAREGSLTRCARVANDARRQWDASFELPDGLRALRSCLFFEQRRAQKSGYGFDEGRRGTLPYVRALVEAIREEVENRPSPWFA
jgi:hypothetical protein